MNEKELNRLIVINVADGSKVGEVERAYVDPKRKNIVGFAIDTGGGLFSPESAVMADTIEVHSLGSGALTLDSATPRGGETTARYDDLVDLASLHGHEVYTDDGTHLGKIDRIEFDEHTFALASFTIPSGLMGGGRAVPIGEVLTIGPELVIVSRGAGERARQTATSG